MNTEELIRRLSSEVTPIAPHALEKRLLLGAGAGFLLSAIFLMTWLGPQPDMSSPPFAQALLTKVAYTSLLAIGAMAACIHLMRPEGKPAAWFALALGPVAVLGGLAAAELIRTPQDAWPALIVGQGVTVCLIRVLTVAIPVFTCLLWAARRFAPTQLRAAGASIGSAAGSMGAAIYAIHCIETSACFIFLWYSAAIMIAAGLGALIAPKFLRW